MASCSLTSKKIHLNITLLAGILVLSLASCQSSGGGITIAQNDSTAPTLTFGVGQPAGQSAGGQNVTVSAGGSAQTMKLTSKSGALNLLATAKDPESGIQAVEIWMNKKTTSCDAGGICTTNNPGLLGAPMFESTSPQKNPGQTTPDGSILLQAVNLSMEIPQASVLAGESLRVSLIFHAVAVNHLGGRTQTPEITATWSEP